MTTHMTTQKITANHPAFPEFIADLRTTLSLTQEKLAHLLGVTFPTVNRWEKGKGKPSPLALDKIEKLTLDLGPQGKELLEKHFGY